VAAGIPSFETALEIFRWFVAQDPSNEEWRRSVAFRLIDLGSARGHLGDRTAASVSLAEARAMAEDALGAEASNPSWRRALAWSQRGLGGPVLGFQVLAEAAEDHGARSICCWSLRAVASGLAWLLATATSMRRDSPTALTTCGSAARASKS
jgi:hypothetical protein